MRSIVLPQQSEKMARGQDDLECSLVMQRITREEWIFFARPRQVTHLFHLIFPSFLLKLTR